MNEKKKIKFTCTAGYADVFPYRDIMRKVAKECNANFRIFYSKAEQLERHLLEIPHKHWMLLLQVSDTRPLRMEIDVKAKCNFDFTLSEEDFIERLIKKVYNRDIETKWKPFDDKYLISSNKSDLAKQLLKKEFQEIILEHQLYSLSIQTDENKTNKCKIMSVIQRQPAFSEETLNLIQFYKDLLDSLQHLHVIY